MEARNLVKTDYPNQYQDVQTTAVFIDFMSFIRGQKLDQQPDTPQADKIFSVDDSEQDNDQWTFGKMIREVFSRVIKHFASAATYHFIFDSYTDYSLKGGERTARSGKSKGVINLAKIVSITKVPEQMEKFWCSEQNKIKLQQFAKEKIIELARIVKVNVIMSGTVSDEDCTPASFYRTNEGDIVPVPQLQSALEEADMRLIPHIGWELESNQSQNTRKFIVVSKDTDIAVLLLFYMKTFKLMGLSELYMCIGIGDKVRKLPLHLLHIKLGDVFCKALLKMHLGTGCDYLSKVGTKYSGLNAKPELNLLSFGESANLDESQVDEAEKFLVMVMDTANRAPKKSKNGPNKSQDLATSSSSATANTTDMEGSVLVERTSTLSTSKKDKGNAKKKKPKAVIPIKKIEIFDELRVKKWRANNSVLDS